MTCVYGERVENLHQNTFLDFILYTDDLVLLAETEKQKTTSIEKYCHIYDIKMAFSGKYPAGQR